MAEHPSHGPAQAGHEKRDVNVRKVAIYGIGLVVVLTLIAIGASFLVFRYLIDMTESEVAPPSPLYDIRQQPPPEPRLLPEPWRNMAELRAAGEQRLGTYGWVDRANGVVRIPIGHAMDLLVQRGLPERPDGLEVAPPAVADSAPKTGMGVKK
jgi:hypothetical protein